MPQSSLNLVELTTEFYQKIATVKNWIQDEQLLVEAKLILKLQEQPTHEDAAHAMSLFLSQWLNQQRQYWTTKLSERQAIIFDQACFALAAMADEIFILELDWIGQPYWSNVLLEDYFYQSCSAGGTLYRQFDRLLQGSKHDSFEIQLASVYLLVLRLGFAGQYRDDPILEQYRDKLFKLVSRHQAISVDYLQPQAYQHNLKSQYEQRLAPIGNWYRGIAYGTTLFLTVGVVAWLLLNQELFS